MNRIIPQSSTVNTIHEKYWNKRLPVDVVAIGKLLDVNVDPNSDRLTQACQFFRQFDSELSSSEATKLAIELVVPQSYLMSIIKHGINEVKLLARAFDVTPKVIVHYLIQFNII